MRVLFLATYFPKPGNPGMGTWALAQAQALRRLPIELRVVSFTSWVPKLLAGSRGARAYAECPPVHDWGSLRVEYPRWLAYPIRPISDLTYRLPQVQSLPGWWSARGYLHRLVESWRPDVVFAHHSLTNGNLAQHLREEFGTPYVVTDHDVAEVSDCARFPLRRGALARVARDAFAMLSVSSRMEREFRAIFPSARTQTLYNGTDPIPSEVLATPRPPKLGTRPVIFSAAMFYERKALPLLVEAFGRAAAGVEGALLRIAGDGPLRPQLEAAIRSLGLSDKVQLLGLIPHRQVLQEMVWADAFALVGWNEPFGVVFAEALAAGRPVVLASDAGAAEVVEHGVQGLVVPPRDLPATEQALRELLRDRSLRLRLGAAGRDLWSSRLTWDSNASTLLGLFRDAVTAATRHAAPAPS